LKVGYSSDAYLSRRNIINIVDHYDYVKVYNIYTLLYKLALMNKKILNCSMRDISDINYSYNDLNLNKVDLLHFFNTISFGKTPWITTFESIVPRFKTALSCHHGENCDYSSVINNRKILKALEALSGNSCKKLIAISECSLNMQKDFLLHFPEYQSEIESKLICLHPPQKTSVENFENKHLPMNKQIHFMFVGNDFFRKGGMEILETFIELRKSNHYDLKLTIVSSLTADNYATITSKTEVNDTKEIIGHNSKWINYYSYIPNSQVMEIMKSVHIGLLPTYADTYGFSVLEFQASGCPVISTNVRALPEINNNDSGWIIEIPRNRFGEAIYTNIEDRNEIGRLIKEKLKEVICEIMENRDLISIKADRAIKHIKDNHSPEKYSRKIGEIYNDALL